VKVQLLLSNQGRNARSNMTDVWGFIAEPRSFWDLPPTQEKIVVRAPTFKNPYEKADPWLSSFRVKS
jgi:hypothetical protein